MERERERQRGERDREKKRIKKLLKERKKGKIVLYLKNSNKM